MILVEGVTVVYGRTIALDGIDLEIGPGVTGLFGANGSGKTTLLRVLAGLVRPATGRASLGGAALAGAPEEVRGRIGFAGHASGLYPALSVIENLRLFALLHGAPPERATAVAGSLGLAGYATTPVGALSAGLKRRAAVARALVHEPDLLLLDEPYANLDDDAAALVSAAVGRWRAPGRAAVIATHGAKRVKAFADAGVILRNGTVAVAGVYRR